MTLWSSLLATYNAVESASGLVEDAGDASIHDARTTLVPLNYMTFKSQLHVTLNADGGAVNIEKDARPVTVLAPCTEGSKGRTSKPVANPLFDKLMYVDRKVDSDKTTLYLKQLDAWKGENTKLNAVYEYVSHHSVSEDCSKFGVELVPYTKDEKGRGKPKDANMGVRFSVVLPGDLCPDLQDDAGIRQQWQAYVRGDSTGEFARNGYDEMGEPLFLRARNYPKKILPTAGNAKLISSNDSDGFTFRGRFASKDDALFVDSMSSEKAHAVLQWLIANNAKVQDTQAIVIWRVVGQPVEFVLPFDDSFDIGAFFANGERTDADILREASLASGRDYAQLFRKLLRGYGDPKHMKEHESKVVVAIFDSATPGRLSVTYYKELERHEYIESILQWHVDSSWTLMKRVPGASVTPFIGAPSVRDVINATYPATDRTSESYKRYTRNVEKQLIECMFNNSAMPASILWNGYHKVTRPMAYDKRGQWDHDVDVVCGLWRKHYVDQWRLANRNDTQRREDPKQSREGAISMKLEPERADRDYLYGRLLALADWFEGGILRKEKVDRPTNAMKLMGNYSAKPFMTWGALEHQLTPYFKPEFGYFWFQNAVDEVMALFRPGDFESNKPLTPLYLLGYSAQRHELMERARQAKEAKSTQE